MADGTFCQLTSARPAPLERGSTTVRDLGSPNEAIFPLRDAIRDGICRGPRIIAAGYVITTPTGHCHFMGQHASDPITAREAATRQIAAGADVIKVEEMRIPSSPIQNETVPLHTQGMTGGDVTGKLMEHAA